MFKAAGKKSACHFPKVFQVEWSIVFYLPGERTGSSLSSWSTYFPFVGFLQLDVTIGRWLNLSWLCFLKEGLPKLRQRSSVQSSGEAFPSLRTAPGVIWARAWRCYCNTDQSERGLSDQSQVCCVTSLSKLVQCIPVIFLLVQSKWLWNLCSSFLAQMNIKCLFH